METKALLGAKLFVLFLPPLRGFDRPRFTAQGLTPLAINFRPYRGFMNSCGIIECIHNVEYFNAYTHTSRS